MRWRVLIAAALALASCELPPLWAGATTFDDCKHACAELGVQSFQPGCVRLVCCVCRAPESVCRKDGSK
jgi:hypothetical protein